MFYGWLRTTLSIIVLITELVTGLLQMTMRVLVDRFGSRYLLGIGVGLVSLSGT